MEGLERLSRGGLGTRLRLLPYRAAGVECGFLLAVRADSVRVGGEELGISWWPSRPRRYPTEETAARSSARCKSDPVRTGRRRKGMNLRLRIYTGIQRLLTRLGLSLPGKVMYIGGSDTLPAPLPREEEAELIARLEEGDEWAKKRLIEHNLRLVVYIARRFENTGVGLEDLISIGTIGLIKAVSTYKPAKNIKLATYASRCIENEILMHLRKTSNQKTEVSFDEPLNTDWDGNELLLSDVLGTESDLVMRPIEEDVDRQLLFDALEKLEPRERRSSPCASGSAAERSRPRRRLPTGWGFSQSYLAAGKADHLPAQAGESCGMILNDNFFKIAFLFGGNMV